VTAGLLVAVLRSEWTKFRTVRSTYWSLVAAAVAALGLGALITLANASSHDATGADFDPTQITLAGLFFAQLAIGVLAVLTVSAEYSSGMIRSTLTAVPRRGYVLAAKAVLAGVVALAVGLVLSFAAFEIGAAIFGSHGRTVSLSQPGVTRAVIGGGLYVCVLAVLAVGLAFALRSSAGSITAVVGIFFVVPAVAAALPDSWQHRVVRYLPAQAGDSVLSVFHDRTSLGPWAGFGVFCAWAALAVVVGAVALSRRDV
jgi:ABC-2 type transport system permease protein